jgi:hypothetical protein
MEKPGSFVPPIPPKSASIKMAALGSEEII